MDVKTGKKNINNNKIINESLSFNKYNSKTLEKDNVRALLIKNAVDNVFKEMGLNSALSLIDDKLLLKDVTNNIVTFSSKKNETEQEIILITEKSKALSLEDAINHCYDIEFVERTLNSDNVDTVDINNNTYLMILLNNHTHLNNDIIEFVNLLISRGANVNAYNKKNNTPLHIVCKSDTYNSQKIVEILLKAGANINVKDINDNTPLHLICKYNIDFKVSVNITNILLNAGADINIINNQGLNVLFIAYVNKKSHIVDIIVKLDPIIPDKINNEFILDAACREGNLKIFNLCVGGNTNINNECRLSYPITSAAIGGNMEIIKYLIEHNVNIEVCNSLGNTALLCACIEGHKEVVEYLLEKGANVNCANNKKSTPLIITSYLARLSIVKILLKYNPNIDDVDHLGNTALINASIDIVCVTTKFKHNINENNKPKIVELLIKNNCQLDIKNLKGNNVLMCICEHNRANIIIIKLIVQAGINLTTLNNNNMFIMDIICDMAEYDERRTHNYIDKSASDKIIRLFEKYNAPVHMKYMKYLEEHGYEIVPK